MQYAAENIIPCTLELGGKSPNIFFSDICDEDGDFFDKALEGFGMFGLDQGEVCACPTAPSSTRRSTTLHGQGARRVDKMKQGNPLDDSTMVGAQASNDQWRRSCPTSTSVGRKGRRC